MEKVDNYKIQARQAKDYFLTYDQAQLLRKFGMEADEQYFYIPFMGLPYRLNRKTGDLEYREAGVWQDGNSHGEVMTLLDILCDSRVDRCLSGKLRNLQGFGRLFHTKLAEDPKDPLARAIQENREGFLQAGLAMGGREVPGGDLSMAFPVMDGLEFVIQFWEADEDFPPSVRYFMDENALMYMKYETMWFALGLLKRRIFNSLG